MSPFGSHTLALTANRLSSASRPLCPVSTFKRADVILGHDHGTIIERTGKYRSASSRLATTTIDRHGQLGNEDLRCRCGNQNFALDQWQAEGRQRSPTVGPRLTPRKPRLNIIISSGLVACCTLRYEKAQTKLRHSTDADDRAGIRRAYQDAVSICQMRRWDCAAGHPAGVFRWQCPATESRPTPELFPSRPAPMARVCLDRGRSVAVPIASPSTDRACRLMVAVVRERTCPAIP